MPAWPGGASRSTALAELERRVHAALSTYSNVHRGTGQYSEATTALYERARAIVLDHFTLDSERHVVIFCSPHGAKKLEAQLGPGCYHALSSQNLGLPLGVRALAVERRALPKGVPPQTGGGTAQLVSPNSIIWDDVPDRFEAGTPAIVNIIATACALQLTRHLGHDVFRSQDSEATSVAEIFHRDEFSSLRGVELMGALKSSMIGCGTQVPTAHGSGPYTNLDNAASTSTFAPVWDTVCWAWRQPEQVRQETIREVRKLCAEFVDAPSDEYTTLFTSNTTEAINAVVSSLRGSVPEDIQPVVLNTWLEHHSNELPWRGIPDVPLLRLSVDDEGFIDLVELARLLREYNLQQDHGRQRIVLLAVSGASNVLGSYNDLAAISGIAHKYGARVLVDAAQLVAHRRIEVAQWGLDYLAFSGHKAYAPFGSGALIVRRDIVAFQPFAWEMLNASGEENLVGIVAMGKALSLLQRIGMDVIEAEERRLTLHALDGLSTIPDIEIWGVRASRSSRMQHRGGIIAFSLKCVPHNLVAQELAERGGIGVRSGCHCAHLLVKRLLRIHPLRAKAANLFLGLLPKFTRSVLPGLVRVSFGVFNDERDVEHLLRIVRDIADTPRSRSVRFLASTHNGVSQLPRSSVGERMSGFIEALLSRVYPGSVGHGAQESSQYGRVSTTRCVRAR